MQVAYRMIKRSAEEQGMGVWQYIRRGRDPTTVGEQASLPACLPA